jgi:hypothetical protein
MSCIPITVSTDKLDQAGNFFALAQAGRVAAVPRRGDGVAGVPRGLHDDIVSTGE